MLRLICSNATWFRETCRYVHLYGSFACKVSAYCWPQCQHFVPRRCLCESFDEFQIKFLDESKEFQQPKTSRYLLDVEAQQVERYFAYIKRRTLSESEIGSIDYKSSIIIQNILR